MKSLCEKNVNIMAISNKFGSSIGTVFSLSSFQLEGEGEKQNTKTNQFENNGKEGIYMVKKYSYRVRARRVSPESNYPLKTKRKASFSSLLTHTHTTGAGAAV